VLGADVARNFALTVTVAARTSPWCLAPGRCQVPSTCTSPLKEPANAHMSVTAELALRSTKPERSATRDLNAFHGRALVVPGWRPTRGRPVHAGAGCGSATGLGLSGLTGLRCGGFFPECMGILPLYVWPLR